MNVNFQFNSIGISMFNRLLSRQPCERASAPVRGRHLVLPLRELVRELLANRLGVHWASMGIGSGGVPLRQPGPLTCSDHGLVHEGTRASALRRVSVTSCESGRGNRDFFQRRACGSLEGGLAGAQAQTAI